MFKHTFTYTHKYTYKWIITWQNIYIHIYVYIDGVFIYMRKHFTYCVSGRGKEYSSKLNVKWEVTIWSAKFSRTGARNNNLCRPCKPKRHLWRSSCVYPLMEGIMGGQSGPHNWPMIAEYRKGRKEIRIYSMQVPILVTQEN